MDNKNTGKHFHSAAEKTRQVVGWKGARQHGARPASACPEETGRLDRAAPWAQAHWAGGSTSAHASGIYPRLLLSELPIAGVMKKYKGPEGAGLTAARGSSAAIHQDKGDPFSLMGNNVHLHR